MDKFKIQLFDNRRGYAKRCAKHIEKTLSQYDELIVHVTKKAMEVTEVAVKAQDEERKKMMVAIRYGGHKCTFDLCQISFKASGFLPVLNSYMYLYSYRLISLLLLMYSPLRRLLSLFPPGAQQKRLPAAYRLN